MDMSDYDCIGIDKYVCDVCVEDEYLRSRIRSTLQATACDYCGRESTTPIAAPVHVVLEPIAETVDYYFSEPATAGLPRDDGEWLIESTDTEEVLLQLGLSCHDDLFADIRDAFTNDGWIPAANGHWSSLHPNEAYKYSWDRFCEWIKHETRYFFSQVTYPIEYWDPQQIDGRNVLSLIAQLVVDLDLGATVPKDTTLYRARKRTKGENWTPNADSMGAPSSQQASAGRMNPTGISYLYLAFEELTAVTEVIGGAGTDVSVAAFQAIRDLNVLDLTKRPANPSIYDAKRRDQREGLMFLDHFVKAISKPVAKDASEHISYVPSQVVSEFFALIFKNKDGTPLDGIAFPSSVCHHGKNLVLFPTERGIGRQFATVEFKNSHKRAEDDSRNH